MISQFVLVTSAVEFVREPEPGQREAEFVRQPAVEFVSEPEPGLSQRGRAERARARMPLYMCSHTLLYTCVRVFLCCVYIIYNILYYIYSMSASGSFVKQPEPGMLVKGLPHQV